MWYRYRAVAKGPIGTEDGVNTSQDGNCSELAQAPPPPDTPPRCLPRSNTFAYPAGAIIGLLERFAEQPLGDCISYGYVVVEIP